MRFDNDIFISYAHLDNQPLIKDAEGWVSQFHRALEVRVDQLLGKKSSVWRDPKLHGNDYYADKIFEELPAAAVLVSVFTPRYVKSNSCTTELLSFCDGLKKSGGLRVQDKTRVFKVLKTPVPIDDHPQPVRDCLGYEFFQIDSVTGRVRELNQVFGRDIEREFWIRLDDLAQDLCELLKMLEVDAVGTAEDDEGDRKSVFLASCTADVRRYHDTIKRDLLAHGCRVLPDRPLPLNAEELVAVLREHLQASCLAVHIIGNTYGIVPEGTDRSIVELQNEVAMEREALGDFSRTIWIPQGLQVEDHRQSKFVEELRSNPKIFDGADLLETPLEDLITQIHHTLSPGPAAQRRKPDAMSVDDDEVRSVYLMCDARDKSNAEPVADYLFDQGCEVVLPAFSGNEAEVRAYHEENLRGADGVLIYFGAPNELWLRSKLRDRRKSAGFGRKKSLKATAILVAPPNSNENSWLKTHEARVIRQPSSFSPELLEPFLADLRT